MRLLLLSLALVTAPSPAQANCAQGSGYRATVTNNTVTICPQNFANRHCPAGGMLRQDVATAAAVTLAEFCSGTGDSSCYVDECVPAGNYRYGFATPYACCSSCCGTDYFTIAEVKTMPGGCSRSPGNSAPSPAPSVPWGSSQSICGYGGGDCSIGFHPRPGGPALFLLVGIAFLVRRRST